MNQKTNRKDLAVQKSEKSLEKSADFYKDMIR